MATLVDALETAAREGCGFVMLTRGKFALCDEGDLELLSIHKWHCSNRGAAVGRVHGPRKLMHRFLTAVPDGIILDHKNRNALDNRRGNLRRCSQRQNMGNAAARKRANSRSKYKGVSRATRQKTGNMWVARGVKDGKALTLAYFATEIEAAREYDRWALGYFGGFAFVNGV